jgi:hypothetical protein
MKIPLCQGGLTVGPVSLAGAILLVDPLTADVEGGDPACRARLVGDECGAITAAVHRASWSRLRA